MIYLATIEEKGRKQNVNDMRVKTKGKKYGELIKKSIIETENIDNQDAFEEELNRETEAVLAREQIFEKLSPEERAKPETREWFDGLDWYKFQEHFSHTLKRKEEIKAYLKTENYSKAQTVKYLTEEISKLKKQITRSDLGREILLNFKLEFYLQLFNPTPDLIVENDEGREFDFGKTEIDKIGIQIAEYGAYEDILNEYGPIVPEDPHLKDVARTEEHYHAIITVLKDQEIIDEDSQKWIVTKEFSKKFIGNFIRLLYYKDFYKEIEITDSIVQSIAMNTFAQSIGIRYSKGGDYTDPELKRIVKKIQEEYIKTK